MTDDEFFSATEQLRTIRQWAHARYAAAWAVLIGVLLRVSATTEPNVQLPGVIGGRASLNLLGAFVSPSGGGKGISDKVARLAWPAPIVERPIGSGEGIAATFVPPKKEGQERVTRAIITVPEIDTLAGLASRQGSILLAQLKSMAMGEQLGQSNASEATTRIIPGHSYRGCMSLGAQPAHCAVIFNDTTGGTPQRILWTMTTDPDMPEDAPDDPAPLDTRLPLWTAGDDGVVEIGYGPDEIAATIKAAHLARQRGEADALDGHAMLTRCKVAATIAILHHRSVVSELDWQLSGVVMEQSNRTRDWVIAESKKASRQKIRERAMSRAAGEEFISDRKLDRAKKAVLRWLERDGELPANKIRTSMKADLRDYCGSALAELTAAGLVVEIPVDRGTRYRLSESTGCTEVQGQYPQVREGVPPVQGVPSADSTDLVPERVADQSGHPDQTGHPLKQQVSNGDQLGHPDQLEVADHVAPLVDGPPVLHSVPAEGGKRLSAAKWFAAHIASLIASGVDTVESHTVIAAGVAAGYGTGSIHQAASASAQVTTTPRCSRGGRSLGDPDADTYQSARDWLIEWMSRHPGWHTPHSVYAAGEAAGYSKEAVRGASKRSPILKRGSAPADIEWSLDPNYSRESA